MKVVIVEDNAAMRRLMTSRLEERLVTVIAQADTEASAVSTIALNNPDAVLVDLRLQVGSGVGVIRSLRRTGFKGQILVFSSEERASLESLVISLGADGFYDKAHDFEALVDDLRSHFSLAQ